MYTQTHNHLRARRQFLILGFHSFSTTTFRSLLSAITQMKAVAIALAMAASRSVAAVELTQADWESKTAGKSVFVKFQAPW